MYPVFSCGPPSTPPADPISRPLSGSYANPVITGSGPVGENGYTSEGNGVSAPVVSLIKKALFPSVPYRPTP